MFVKWVVWAPATACIGSVFSMGRDTGEFWPPNPPSDPNLRSGRTRDDRGIGMPCSTSSVFFRTQSAIQLPACFPCCHL
ncbi:hypothetical protein BDP55DRAFT_83420 [Colletotrichum godetiae]|uniref:Uncharacterized protein n=1 Tax=Colletotrichum godetiae TaxID=1209918 RepID=A0AAJ0EZM5_9PEZI|nr:uncharacterized protein BDP55DRAFT_83420 [Colletotrichum godetiae]KAK1687673.1 hypothetical protein BDP55DRAFT_83420 [Colletotrichum godetiae]